MRIEASINPHNILNECIVGSQLHLGGTKAEWTPPLAK